MTAYCDRQSVDFNSIAFLFDGRRLRAEQTPDEVRSLSLAFPPFRVVSFPKNLKKSPLLQLDMEEGDEIDAMLHQTGGVTNASGMSVVWV